MTSEATILHFTFFNENSSFQIEVRQFISPKGVSEIETAFSTNALLFISPVFNRRMSSSISIYPETVIYTSH